MIQIFTNISKRIRVSILPIVFFAVFDYTSAVFFGFLGLTSFITFTINEEIVKISVWVNLQFSSLEVIYKQKNYSLNDILFCYRKLLNINSIVFLWIEHNYIQHVQKHHIKALKSPSIETTYLHNCAWKIRHVIHSCPGFCLWISINPIQKKQYHKRRI